MSTGTVIILSAVIIALVALAFTPTVLLSSRALRRRFGPEYQRAVEQHGGDVKAARKELSERLYRYGDLPLKSLETTTRERYRTQWADIHLRWLNAPAEAVLEAESLIGRLAADRGFPSGDGKQLMEALSVRYAWQVGGLRRLCAAAARVRAGEEKTVDLRGVLSGAQGIFEQLVNQRPHVPVRRPRTELRESPPERPLVPRQRARQFPTRA
jgi:hypothetical protein